MLKRPVLLLAAMALFSGCAYAIRGDRQDVLITCDVPGAKITVDGAPVGSGWVSLARGEAHVVVATAEGCPPAKAFVRSVTSAPWTLLDSAIGAAGFVAYGLGEVVTFIPLVVDGATGALDDLEPREVKLDLVPVERLPLEPALEPSGRPTLFCTRCGAEFETESRFCGGCGAARGTLRRRE
jgi:hypothetical protein